MRGRDEMNLEQLLEALMEASVSSEDALDKPVLIKTDNGSVEVSEVDFSDNDFAIRLD